MSNKGKLIWLLPVFILLAGGIFVSTLHSMGKTMSHQVVATQSAASATSVSFLASATPSLPPTPQTHSTPHQAKKTLVLKKVSTGLTAKTKKTKSGHQITSHPIISKVIAGATFLSDGLVIPPLGQPIPKAPTVPGYPQFSSAFINGAYDFALGFVYQSCNMTSIWDPNTAKNPNYLTLLNNDFSDLGQYFSPDLRNVFLNAVPNLVNPMLPSKSSSLSLNSDASQWGQLILIPGRSPDGTLYSSEDPSSYSLMAPWSYGFNAGAPLTSVVKLDPYGDVLNIRFSYSINLVFGDQKQIKGVWKLTKTTSFNIIPNPSTADALRNPYLIASFGQDNNATLVRIPGDPASTLSSSTTNKNEFLYP